MARVNTPPSLSNTDIRRALLQYFYDRNAAARGVSGAKGPHVRISVLRRDMKQGLGLSAQEVIANLTYLLSEGWVNERLVTKAVTTSRGVTVPSETRYYMITARGIDKIEGPGEFTVPKLDGIRIETTGRNIIAIGDGNQADAQFHDVAEGLASLKDAVKRSQAVSERDKVNCVGDIESIQSQLVKSAPNTGVIDRLWTGIERIASVAGLVDVAQKVYAALPV